MKIEAKWKGTTSSIVKIVEQSAEETEWLYGQPDSRFVHGSIALVTGSFPEWRSHERKLFVRGASIAQHNKELLIPNEYIPSILEAVGAFNVAFAKAHSSTTEPSVPPSGAQLPFLNPLLGRLSPNDFTTVMSALRGPDTLDDGLKRKFTYPIRKFVEPGRTTYCAARVPTTAEIRALLDEALRESAFAPWQDHYRQHLVGAYRVILAVL